ncbi:GIY-YIG nuclease family protein [Priestia aryabhattai]|uniref:GIY-YIG nuclease family protein n=1 Tax=Priestia aryabhattai TaxID=412384 RepID=UPI0039A26119
MYGIIYKITNLVNGKVYIGQSTRNLISRKREHFSDARVGSKLPIHNAIRKYGEASFIFEVIDEAFNEDELNNKEIHWIKDYNSYVHWNESNGYNCSLGGDKAGVGESHPMYGKHGAENPNSISVVQLSTDGEVIRIHPSATVGAEYVNGSNGNITSCCRGKITHVYNSIWIYESEYNDEYVKERVSDYDKKSNRNAVIQLTKDGDFIAEHLTAKVGAEAIGGHGTSITACCKCKPKYKTYKGFIWMYKVDYENTAIREERILRANSRWK